VDPTDEVVIDFCFIIKKMNKLNEKVIADEFSPWEESFNDLFKTMELSKRKKAIQEATRTL
jgi:hypothetical protein